MKFLIVALIGALASILANKGVAVFNDGLRPIVPEYLEGRMDKKALAATSFALGFGLVIGFGIPVSIAASIILIHSILLGTDIIGTWSPSGKKGMAVSGVIGAVYGVGIVAGLQFIVDAFKLLPVNFLGNLGQVGTPIVAAFAAFPALVVAYQYGILKGGITFVVSFIVRQIVQYYGTFQMGTAKVALNPEGMALLAGMIIMLVYAMTEKADPNAVTVDLTAIFSERVKKIKRNLPYLAAIGGLIAAATSYGIIAGDPISLNLLAKGSNVEAAMTAFARGIGFIPLVATTAIATGVYGPAGMTFVFVVGLLVKSPILAFLLGAVVISAEVMLLDVLAKMLDKFPGVRKCGDNIRTAMSKLLEVALLVGGMMAANAMAPGLGLFIVAGLYVLNQTAKKPIVSMAVGPVGAVVVGILINVLYVVGLYLPPAAK
ncbi:YhfT family protein [Clostridium swellfunianum]|uniref:YhfT family protein n=1 Tax=Clostridium swellfunianum TaxID=1367462 RepID=UPI00202DC7ED|nr:YhfT family protein [Clostridium swellfunianum]MCM0649736.1 YhfT family protein [Clostridium swellfunianum]